MDRLRTVSWSNSSHKIAKFDTRENFHLYGNRNWLKVYHDMEELFESWKRRKLTILRKCCIVNTLVLSKLIYVASLLPLPPDDLVKILIIINLYIISSGIVEIE